MEPPDGSVRLRASGAEPPSPARPLPPRVPFGVVWAGVLGGARAQAVPVLAGGLDDALAQVAPRATARIPGVPDPVVAPTRLADLRPSRIAGALPHVRALLRLADLDDQGAGADALAASGAPAGWVERALAFRDRAPSGPASALDRLMALAGPDDAGSLREAVEREVARVQAALAADPDVAGLERAWRGLAWLARRLDLRGDVRLTAVTAPSLDELAESGALAQAAAGASLVVVDAEIGPAPRDVALAHRLAALGAAAGVPVVASAAPGLVGAEPGGAVPPQRHGADPVFAGWATARQRPEMRALALAYPAVRLAPGRELWGGGAIAVAADAAGAWARGDGASGLGRAGVPDLAADALAVTLGAPVAADLARHGLCPLVPDGPGARVGAAPTAAATAGPAARDAALSLPAALFAARLARVAEADDPLAAIERELSPWGRLEQAPGGVRAVLPAGASPTLAADVAVTVRGAP